MADLIGSRIIQAILPTVLKENIEAVSYFVLLSYVLFLVNWLATTDWIEKVSVGSLHNHIMDVHSLFLLTDEFDIDVYHFRFHIPAQIIRYSCIYFQQQHVRLVVSF